MKMERLIGLLVTLVFPTLACGQEFNLSPTYAGEAMALQVTPWQGQAVVVADTGLAPATGGQQQNSAPGANPFPGIVAQQLYAVTLGQGGRNHSQASLAYLDATLGKHRVTALWAEAEANATAGFLSVPTGGKCTFGELIVDGQIVQVSGQPNQTITFPDGYLIINEQIGSGSRNVGTLTVNALHLQVDGVGSVIAASAKAAVDTSPTPNPGF